MKIRRNGKKISFVIKNDLRGENYFCLEPRDEHDMVLKAQASQPMKKN